MENIRPTAVPSAEAKSGQSGEPVSDKKESVEPPEKPRIHRSRYFTMALAGFLASVYVAKKEDIASPVQGAKIVVESTVKSAPEQTRAERTGELPQMVVQLPTLLHSDIDDFVTTLKKVLQELPFDNFHSIEGVADIWCAFAQEYPGRFLRELESFNLPQAEKLIYATAAIKQSDISTVSNWLYQRGGHEFIHEALIDNSVGEPYKDVARELELESYPKPDEVEKLIETETTEERETRLMIRMNADLDGFVKELQERIEEILPLTWEAFLKKHPNRSKCLSLRN